MTLDPIVELTAAELQLKAYNEASAMVKRKTYSTPGGVAWAVIGCVLNDPVTQADVENTLVPAIVALAQVTSVMDERVWVPAPASILANPEPPADPTHEVMLHVGSNLAGTQVFTGEGSQTYQSRAHRTLALTLAKNAVVFVIRVPSELNAAGRTALESAVTAITGISLTETLISGAVPANVTGGQLTVEARMRIDPIAE